VLGGQISLTHPHLASWIRSSYKAYDSEAQRPVLTSDVALRCGGGLRFRALRMSIGTSILVRAFDILSAESLSH
jgi:hypothetical protein